MIHAAKHARRRARRRAVIAAIGALLSIFCAAFISAQGSLEGRIVNITSDGFYLDIGSNAGLRAGTVGTLRTRSLYLDYVVVVRTTRNSALLRLLAEHGSVIPATGDRVVFDSLVRDRNEALPARRSSSWRRGERETKGDFLPLLSHYTQRKVAVAKPINLFHGRLRMRTMTQKGDNSKMGYWYSRIDSNIRVTRVAGSRWTLAWVGNSYLKDGPAVSRSNAAGRVIHRFTRLELSRKFRDGGFARVGRLLPRGLPSLGYIDGGQREWVVRKNLRVGGVFGLKPISSEYDIQGQRPTASPYFTMEAGRRRELYYSGTVGLLGTAYRGKMDRLALLHNQLADIGPKLTLYSSMGLDFDLGSRLARRGVRLTRLNLHANSPINSHLTLRAGVDHFERPDTLYERALLAIEDPKFFDQGFWRYWIGGSQSLLWNLRFDERISILESATADSPPTWRMGVTRTGLFALRQARLSFSAYNFYQRESQAFGGLFSVAVPLADNRVNLSFQSGFRQMDFSMNPEESRKTFKITDFSLRGSWRVSGHWTLDAGVSHRFSEFAPSTLYESSFGYRW